MKKSILSLVLVIGLVMFPITALARSFTLSQSQLSQLGAVYYNPGGGYTYLIAEGSSYNPLGNPDYFTGPVEGGYQFYGQQQNRPEWPVNWAETGIGAVLEKKWSHQRDTLEDIGASDLTGYGEFALTFFNNRIMPRSWWVSLFLHTGYTTLGEPDNLYQSGWVELETHKSATLSLDLTTVAHLDHVTSLGFVVGSDLSPGSVKLYVMQVYPVFAWVPLDVKPGSCPNPLNIKSKGVLPVAILGTEDFDVHKIDIVSIELEGVKPIRSSYEDVAAPFEPFIGKGDTLDCTYEGPDGYLDLTLKFDTQEVLAALGEVEDGQVLVLTLIGNLQEEFGETPIQGEDVVIVLKKGK